MTKILLLSFIFLLCTTHQMKATDPPTKEEKEFYNHLYKLTSQGNIDSVKYILDNPQIDLSRYDKDNQNFNPIIYAAVWNGNKELVEYLVSKGADPKAANSSNETALHRAAWNGNLEMVKLLVEHGADLNIIYAANGGLSPLCCAAESGNIEVVKYLIEKGADVNYNNSSSGASPLRSAAYKAHYDIFLLLAEKQPQSYDWQEALFYGLIGGNPDIVKYIIEKKGANVNRKSKIWNEYPIEKAARDRFTNEKNSQPVEVVKYLVSKGAGLSTINNGKVFPWAMENCSEEMIGYLIEQGVKVKIPQTEDGWTPLASALDNGNLTLARYLIKQTNDYTFRNKPLIVFFADGMYDSPQIIDLLIKEGINKEYYNEALAKSVSANDSVSIELLLSAGAELNMLNTDGSNLLHLVHSYPIAKLLIEKGVDTQNRIMLENAWKNPDLLKALDEVAIIPPIQEEDMNSALLTASLLGDTWTSKYMLERGANVNFSPLDLPSETDNQKPRNLDGLSEEQERSQEAENNYKQAYQQTPLIKNAMQGYSFCNYGNYKDEKSKIQISADIAKILLEAGADANITDSRGRTALHYTAGSQWCRSGMWPIPMGSRRDREHGMHGEPAPPPKQYHDSIALLLIKYGADLNIKDNNGNTPLIVAAINRNHGVLEMLLKAGADISVKNNRDKDLFSYLDDMCSFQIIKEAGLSKHIPMQRINVAFRKFFTENHSRSEYDVEELKKLLEYGADVKTQIYPNSDTNTLMYVFKRMYGNNKFEIAQLLIDYEIDLYAENNSGYTFFMQLIKEGKEREYYSKNKTPENLEFLIKNNIDINYKSSTQATALTIAICENKPEIITYLLENGAKRDRQSEWWYLVKEKNYDLKAISMLQKLVQEGIDINMQSPTIITQYSTLINKKGVTALMIYTAYGNKDGVKALLSMGANPNVKAEDGTSVLSIAKERGNKDIIDLLLQAGAKE